MRYVYVGNFTNLPNWGCRSTGTALAEILSPEHHPSEQIASETLQDSGWDMFSSYPVRYRGILPPRIFKAAWRVRAALPRVYELVRTIDRTLGAQHDFVSHSVTTSLTRFHEARRHNPRLQEIYESLRDSDLLIVNGEGTMIFSNPARRDVLFTNFMIALASELGKRAFVLNAIFAPCPQSGLNLATLQETIAVLNQTAGIACRERRSFDFLRQHGCTARLATIPDALFSWSDRAQSLKPYLPAFEYGMLPYCDASTEANFDFSKPYICVGGSSSALRLGTDRAIQSYVTLVEALKQVCPNIYVLQTCYWDSFLVEVARRTKTKLVPQSIPVLMGATILAGARLFISGRYHPAILASLTGTPCMFMAANSHKTASLQGTLGYNQPRTYSEIPGREEVAVIAADAEEQVARSEISRKEILANVSKRSVQTREFLNFVNGTEVGQLI